MNFMNFEFPSCSHFNTLFIVRFIIVSITVIKVFIFCGADVSKSLLTTLMSFLIALDPELVVAKVNTC